MDNFQIYLLSCDYTTLCGVFITTLGGPTYPRHNSLKTEHVCSVSYFCSFSCASYLHCHPSSYLGWKLWLSDYSISFNLHIQLFCEIYLLNVLTILNLPGSQFRKPSIVPFQSPNSYIGIQNLSWSHFILHFQA